MERPAARPTEDEPTASGDWVYIGDVPGTVFSVDRWFKRLLSFGVRRHQGQPFFLHRDKTQPFTYTAGLEFLRVMQRRVGASEVPGLHGIRVLGNNLSRNTNGEELTQFHGGWLSRAGRSRYDRFEPRDVVSIPARMVGRPSPLDGAPGPRDVVRFAHLERRGPQAGDPVQRLVLPAALAGATLTGRSRPEEASAAQAPSAAPLRTAARAATVTDLCSDPRGAGVLLPEGYVEETCTTPTGRSYKKILAPDGGRLQSRAEAWRHYAEAAAREAREFHDSIGRAYEFDAPSDGDSDGGSSSPPVGPARRPVPGSAPARHARRRGSGSVSGSHPRPPSPELPPAEPGLAQPTVASRGTRVTPTAGVPAPGPRPKPRGRGSRLRGELL